MSLIRIAETRRAHLPPTVPHPTRSYHAVEDYFSFAGSSSIVIGSSASRGRSAGVIQNKKIIKTIIATKLSNKLSSIQGNAQQRQKFSTHKKNTHRGCRLFIPCLWAIAPVINGIMALPACPNPAIQPIAPVRIHGGRIRDDWFMAIGNMGPRRTPINDTVMAFPTREGTNQITKSKLNRIEGLYGE